MLQRHQPYELAIPSNHDQLKAIKIRLTNETNRILSRRDEAKRSNIERQQQAQSNQQQTPSSPQQQQHQQQQHQQQQHRPSSPPPVFDDDDYDAQQPSALPKTPLQGYLRKQGEKGLIKAYKKRWFIQKDSKLFYYEKEGDTQPYGYINLLDMLSVRTIDSGFELATTGRIYNLQVLRPSDLSYWTDGLKELKKCYASSLRHSNDKVPAAIINPPQSSSNNSSNSSANRESMGLKPFTSDMSYESFVNANKGLSALSVNDYKRYSVVVNPQSNRSRGSKRFTPTPPTSAQDDTPQSSSPINHEMVVAQSPDVQGVTTEPQHVQTEAQLQVQGQVQTEDLAIDALDEERLMRAKLETEIDQLKSSLAKHEEMEKKNKRDIMTKDRDIQRLLKDLAERNVKIKEMDGRLEELTTAVESMPVVDSTWSQEIATRDRTILSMREKIGELSMRLKLRDNSVLLVKRENEILRDENEKKDRCINMLYDNNHNHINNNSSGRPSSIDIIRLRESILAHQSQNGYLMTEMSRLETENQLKHDAKDEKINQLETSLNEIVYQYQNLRELLHGTSTTADYVKSIETELMELKRDYFRSLAISFKLQCVGAHDIDDNADNDDRPAMASSTITQSNMLDITSLYEEVVKNSIPFKQWPDWISSKVAVVSSTDSHLPSV
ncbi:hypothetical protein SAMD00019534_045890 [Acytostelium subglobosum LB1]|uniref:hypothetical protein n=1 Tax=Acytostelium subglobosum LB1 TaxID=1410327 RepID=UPI000644F8A1|nr:hypothetical protein SAMD00019534_045890 [Acytostelium subglobosum LB1]GAM21414.1 hypothetical protein SAMD00019534_045890 [Acytostelium subglobosum LB1]|eukprot:XP_012755533.1 hypothetical protein SAMD00019534_045890 [Acytostelium subglobosum LB1]